MNRLFVMIVISWCITLLSYPADAATYYVDGAQADNSGDGLSWATAKKHINAGVNLMNGGDTLYIRDGAYQGDSNRIYDVPSGSAGNYTKIYAENDWGGNHK